MLIAKESDTSKTEIRMIDMWKKASAPSRGKRGFVCMVHVVVTVRREEVQGAFRMMTRNFGDADVAP